MDNQIRKLIREGKVGVIVGAGRPWYCTHYNEALLFLPELIELIESEEYQKLKYQNNLKLRRQAFTLVRNLLIKLGYTPLDKEPTDSYMPGAYLQGINIAGAIHLEVEWIQKGTEFKMNISNDSSSGLFEQLIIIDKTFIA